MKLEKHNKKIDTNGSVGESSKEFNGYNKFCRQRIYLVSCILDN